MERIYVFLGLFSIVYFFEAIGGSYIVSAVQNIERQFQIPSKMSGIMISANDFGYIPTVIFISYLGSKGNRARWIGAGTVMIALTYLAIASPNFLFPTIAPQANTTEIQRSLTPSAALLASNVTLPMLLEYPLIKDRIPLVVRNQIIQQVSGSIDDKENNSSSIEAIHEEFRNNTMLTYSIDGKMLDEAMLIVQSILDGNRDDVEKLHNVLSNFVKRRSVESSHDMLLIRKAAIAPFAFCGNIVNDLRIKINEVKCMQQSSNVGPFIVLFGSLFFLGVGRTMPWSLGVPLVDDNVKRKNMPAYFAGISFIRVLGPICGFLIGSFCNKFYYTLHPPQGLTPADPTWIGAWWIGFIVVGLLTFFPSVALFFFPSSRSVKVRQTESKEEKVELDSIDSPKKAKKSKKLNLVDKHADEEDNRTSMERAKDFLRSYREVLKSRLYTGSVIGRICDILAFKGYMVFLPKYLENHFGIPQYMVHRYMAMFGVFGFALGTVTGGVLMRKLKYTGRQAAFAVLLVSAINTGIFFSKSFIACESIVNAVGTSARDTNYNFTRSCNADCGCDSARLFPVCDTTGAVFFSPCHAGCREAKVNKHNSYDLEFSSCECATGGVVRRDFCQDQCKVPTVIFFATVLLGAFLAGTGVVPGLLILLRSVPPAHRSISLGLQGFLVSLFGTLPSPVIWGMIIDSACLVWDKSCGELGACAIYNPTQLRMRMHLTYASIRFISLFTDMYVWYNAKGLNIIEEEEEIVEDVRQGSIRLKDLPEQ